jgi:hypothetical protein
LLGAHPYHAIAKAAVAFSSTPLAYISAISCGRWRCRSPWNRSLPEKLIKIGAKVVSPDRYVTFRMAEVAVPRQMFREIFVAHRPVAGNPRQRHRQMGVRYDTQI